jgi:hypothetical protein
MEDAANELKIIGLKLAFLLIITPLAGYFFLRVAEEVEKEWKSGIRRKRWIAMCGVFFVIAVIGGWLR